MYQKLKEIREKNGYTIEDIAKVIGKSAPNYYKKENGDVKFSVNEALLIAKFFKRKVETIFFKSELSETEETGGDKNADDTITK